MKQIVTGLILMALIVSGCSSLKKGSSSFNDRPSTKTNASQGVKVKEEAKTPPVKTNTQTVVVKQEKVKVIETQSNEKAGRYYVILGSFKVLENARNFRQQLINESFLPSILENEEGLYRVSVSSYDDEQMARQRIASIRERYEKYSDLWLLIQKD